MLHEAHRHAKTLTRVCHAVSLHVDELGALGESRPLHGKSVVVTRARAQASGLAATLTVLGARVVEAPAIRIEARPVTDEVARAADEIGSYDVVCLTSPNGAELLLAALQQRGLDARALAGAEVAAIGPGTARALAKRGVRADVIPERSIAESLLESLSEMELPGQRVLVARAAEARDVLPDGLHELGATVDVVALYDTVAEPLSADALNQIAEADYVTFTSSSTVDHFLDAAKGLPAHARIVSIGPVTSKTARERGLEVHVEAEQHDVEGLVEALLRDAG